MLIFKNKLVDIEASEIESRLKKFRLNLSDGDSLTGESYDNSSIDQVYSCAEETLKKKFKRQRLSTSEKLYLQACCESKNSNQINYLWLSSFRSNY